ncbi:21226_t:CDS:2 [Gigaspora margarita]|uniref:21226_t:CDS:1 n=1 Tax=Gigaspora margarita TaxID=4874 RepID=A0ABN7VQ27_GIGMA|nr:21226_t:CDS:2 [Gigaspora margarita]
MVNIFRKVFRRLAKICKKRRQKERSIPIETKPVLSNECIQHVFKFIGDKDLYSCLFVNKYWSRNVIPILWSQPFQNLSPKYQKLSFKDLESAVFSWLSTSFRKPIKDTYSLNEQIEQLTTLLCTLFFRSSRNLNSFIIDKFLPFTNIPEVTIFSESGILARLRKLSINFRKLSSIIDLLETLYMNCKNLEYLEINFIEFENEEIIFNSITKLINQQEKLKELRLGNIQSNNGTRNILTSIKSQMNSIETIHLNSINFKGISLKILGTSIIIQSIGKNIQQLWVDIISPEIVQTIIDNCPQLIDLRIMDYQPKQVPFLLNLLKDFNQLEKLTITRETVVEMGVVNFSGKNIPINLKYLRLECGFTTGQLEKLLTTSDYIKTTKSLKVLGIGGKKEYSRRELREIESLEQNYGIYVIPLHEVHDW